MLRYDVDLDNATMSLTLVTFERVMLLASELHLMTLMLSKPLCKLLFLFILTVLLLLLFDITEVVEMEVNDAELNLFFSFSTKDYFDDNSVSL